MISGAFWHNLLEIFHSGKATKEQIKQEQIKRRLGLHLQLNTEETWKDFKLRGHLQKQ